MFLSYEKTLQRYYHFYHIPTNHKNVVTKKLELFGIYFPRLIQTKIILYFIYINSFFWKFLFFDCSFFFKNEFLKKSNFSLQFIYYHFDTLVQYLQKKALYMNESSVFWHHIFVVLNKAYVSGYPNAKLYRTQLMEAKNGDEVENLVQKFKEELRLEQENLVRESTDSTHSSRGINCDSADQISCTK